MINPLSEQRERKMAKNTHVVMLPWSAFGHIIPFFQLSIALTKAGIHVSFVSTPKNIRRLPQIPSDSVPFIDLVELPLPEIDRSLLPADAEATVDIPTENIQYLKIAYDLLKKPFSRFVADRLPDWIVIDMMPHWAVDVAKEFDVPVIYFSVFGAAAAVFWGPPEYIAGEGQKMKRSTPESLTSTPEWVDFPSTVAYGHNEAVSFHAGAYGENASGISDAGRTARKLHSCRALAIRSCPEFEHDYLNLLEKILQKPVIPVGLLPPEQKSEPRNSGYEFKIFKWLDQQKPKSVIFVGFGSECKLTENQIHEIAYGLELSELPFLWSLRKPSYSTDPLPPDFHRRIAEKGLVHIGWAPQTEILAHPSVGGSLFHSGWGSVIETLQFGHRLVVLPLIIDQPLNARLLVEKGLAREVERGGDGSFGRDAIARALREAMVMEGGERVREAMAIFGDRKLQENYVERFAEYLKIGVAKEN